MLLLALDTSSPTAGMCLLEDGRVRTEWMLRGVSPRDTDHIGMLQDLLRRAGVSFPDVDVLACTIGPGGFTGLRVGLSLMKGLAADGGRPLFGVSTLQALARSVGVAAMPVVPCLDARRKEVYAAVYADDAPVVAEGSYDPAEFSAEVEHRVQGPTLWVGEGAQVYESQFSLSGANQERYFAHPELVTSRPVAVAVLAFAAWQRGEPGNSVDLVPNYLRASAAEVNSGSLKKV